MTRRPKQLGGVEWVPGELRWLVATPMPDSMNFEDGGWLEVPEHWDDPELLPILDELLGRYPASWSVALPGKLRAALVDFPLIEDSEYEQATRWQAEKLFHTPAAELATDFEPVAAPAADGSLRSLVVGLRRTTVNGWVSNLDRLRTKPHRVEPIFSACSRALRSAARGERAASAYIHADRSGGSILILDKHQLYYARSLAPDPDDTLTEYSPVFSGDFGVRVLLTSLLACEDRYPNVEIDSVVAFGDIDKGWVNNAAVAARIDTVTQPGPPAGTPGALHENDRWLVPLGTLFGGLE